MLVRRRTGNAGSDGGRLWVNILYMKISRMIIVLALGPLGAEKVLEDRVCPRVFCNLLVVFSVVV